LKILRTTSQNPHFKILVKELDKFLAVTDGNEHSFYNQFNSIDNLKHVVLIQHNDLFVGCGAFKEYDATSVEIKRMFTQSSARGKGVGTLILRELETWAAEVGYKKSVLETGTRQTAAIALYHKNSYTIIPNYGQYKEMENSVCFEKEL